MRARSLQIGWHLFVGAILFSGSTASLLASSCGEFVVEVVGLPYCGLPHYGLDAMGMNELGGITGGYSTCAKELGTFVWTGDAVQLINFGPQKSFAVGNDINSKLQIVGTKEGSTGHVGFFYDNGVTIDIGMLPGSNFAEAHAINELGQIVGESSNVITGPLGAFLWDNGNLRAIITPLGPHRVANDLNDSTQVVGWMGPSATREAFLWENGKAISLGYPRGGVNSEAKAISNNGKVCGACAIPNPSGTGLVLRAFYWSDGEMSEIGTLPGYNRSVARDVNNDGKVVGECFDGGPMRAFLWHNGTMINLNDVMPPEMNLTLKQGKSINNNGQILCAARDANNASVAVLLTPIPSPVGDSDCDSDVDVDDLLKVIHTWGTESPKGSPPTFPPADFNHDQIVNVLDLVIVIDNWTM